MPSYKAPLRDMRFVLNEVADPERASRACRAARSWGRT